MVVKCYRYLLWLSIYMQCITNKSTKYWKQYYSTPFHSYVTLYGEHLSSKTWQRRRILMKTQLILRARIEYVFLLYYIHFLMTGGMMVKFEYVMCTSVWELFSRVNLLMQIHLIFIYIDKWGRKRWFSILLLHI